MLWSWCIGACIDHKMALQRNFVRRTGQGAHRLRNKPGGLTTTPQTLTNFVFCRLWSGTHRFLTESVSHSDNMTPDCQIIVEGDKTSDCLPFLHLFQVVRCVHADTEYFLHDSLLRLDNVSKIKVC